MWIAFLKYNCHLPLNSLIDVDRVLCNNAKGIHTQICRPQNAWQRKKKSFAKSKYSKYVKLQTIKGVENLADYVVGVFFPRREKR